MLRFLKYKLFIIHAIFLKENNSLNAKMSELQNTLSSKTEALNAELQALRSQLGTASDDLSLVRGWKSDTYIVNINDNNITVARSSSATGILYPTNPNRGHICRQIPLNV